MSSSIAVRQSLYGGVGPGPAPGADQRQLRLNVVLEIDSGALPRVFGIMGTLDLIPMRWGGEQANSNCLILELDFVDVAARRVDLFIRKLNQLIECLGVTAESIQDGIQCRPEETLPA